MEGLQACVFCQEQSTISAAETDAGNVFHILGIGCESKPALTETAGPQEIIDEVHRCKGLAVLAHPAWSLNTAQQAGPGFPVWMPQNL